MSGIKPVELSEFYRALHARGEDTTSLAAAVGVSRPALTRVLNGARRRGPIWARVARILRPKELALLNVAQCSAWNNRRLQNRPQWTPQKMAALRVA